MANTGRTVAPVVTAILIIGTMVFALKHNVVTLTPTTTATPQTLVLHR
jgi:hypothetical protein